MQAISLFLCLILLVSSFQAKQYVICTTASNFSTIKLLHPRHCRSHSVEECRKHEASNVHGFERNGYSSGGDCQPCVDTEISDDIFSQSYAFVKLVKVIKARYGVHSFFMAFSASTSEKGNQHAYPLFLPQRPHYDPTITVMRI